jgi:hypothetical protein
MRCCGVNAHDQGFMGRIQGDFLARGFLERG